MKRVLLLVAAVALVAACDQATAPKAPAPAALTQVKKAPASWECRSGVVIHVGRDSVCVEDGE